MAAGSGQQPETPVSAGSNSVSGGKLLSCIMPVCLAWLRGSPGLGWRDCVEVRGIPRPRVTPDSPAALINRELSWLSFARRVLALAEDPEQPVLERVKFAGIMGMILRRVRDEADRRPVPAGPEE